MNKSSFEALSVEEQLTHLCGSGESRNDTFKWFCQLHNPRNKGVDIRADVKKFIHSNNLLDVIQEEIKSPNNPHESVDMLWILSRIDDAFVENEIHKRFIDTLHLLMSNNIQNEEIIEAACIVVGLISSSDCEEESARSTLVHAGVVDLLVSCLKIFQKNSVIVQRATKALTNASYQNLQTKLCVIENGGFSILITLLKSDLNVAAKRCCAQLLRTIVHLSDEHHHTLILSTEAPIQNIVTAMVENEGDALTQWHFLWTILNFSINQRNAKKEFGKRGVCQVVINIMKLYQNESFIQQTAITALRQLATIVTNRMILAHEQFPAVLVDLMGQPTTSPSLIVTILEALRRLCLTGLNRKLLATSQLLSKFRDVAKQHIENVSIANVALNVLANLAHGANATRQGLKQNGIIDFLNTVMVKHHNNSELVHDAYEIAHIIPHEGDVEEETSSESQSEDDEDHSEDEDYSGDDDVSKFINELKTVGSQSVNLETLKATRKVQETEIASLRKKIEEKEEVSQKYSRKIKELNNDIESQYDSSKETILIQNSNSEINQDLEEKRKRIHSLGEVIDNLQEQIDKANNKFLLLGNQEEEENKANEEKVNALKAKIEKKKDTIKQQNMELEKLGEVKKKVIKAEELFEETKSHLLAWIQLAIKLEGLSNGDENFDQEILQQKIKQNFILGLADVEGAETTI